MHLRHDALYASRRSPILAQNVVSTSHPLAAQAGLSMLAKGAMPSMRLSPPPPR